VNLDDLPILHIDPSTRYVLDLMGQAELLDADEVYDQDADDDLGADWPPLASPFTALLCWFGWRLP
jgi:hypothetical protein